MALFKFVAFISLFSLTLSIPICPSEPKEAQSLVKTLSVPPEVIETGINKAVYYTPVHTTSTKASEYHTSCKAISTKEHATGTVSHVSSTHQASLSTTVTPQVGGHAVITKISICKAVDNNNVKNTATEASHQSSTSIQNHKAAVKTPCHKTRTKVLAHKTPSQRPTQKATAISQSYESNGESHAHRIIGDENHAVATTIHPQNTCTKAQNHENETKLPSLPKHLTRTKTYTSYITTTTHIHKVISQNPIQSFTTKAFALNITSIPKDIVNKHTPSTTANILSHPPAIKPIPTELETVFTSQQAGSKNHSSAKPPCKSSHNKKPLPTTKTPCKASPPTMAATANTSELPPYLAITSARPTKKPCVSKKERRRYL